MKYLHSHENISSYLFMHHSYFKHMTSMCKMYKQMLGGYYKKGGNQWRFQAGSHLEYLKVSLRVIFLLKLV